MKAIWHFALGKFKPYKKELAIIATIATFGALLATAVPYIYGRLFDAALLPATPLTLIAFLIFSWLSLSLISDVLSNQSNAEGGVLGYKVSTEAEVSAYAHWLTLPIAFHKRKRLGEILRRINRGAWEFEQLTRMLFELLPYFLIFIFSVTAMAVIRWQLCLILIFFLALYFLVTAFSVKRIIKITQEMQRLWEKQYGLAYDRLFNVFLIKSFAKEQEEAERIKAQLVAKTIAPYRKMRFAWAQLAIAQRIIYSTAFIAVLGFAILSLRLGTLTPGQFIMFFGYIHLAFSPFWRLTEFYRAAKEASVALKRFKKLHDMAPEAVAHGNKELKEVKGNIAFKDVTFSYLKGKNILENINLEVKAGETVAIVGESGVGKTTLVELIAGYYKPEKGQIELDGIPITELKLKWLRDQIALVPQEISLFDDSIENNLRYAKPGASKEELVKACKAAFAHEFIMKLPKGYKTIVGERGVKLSTGQKQRIAIAMAFLKNPKILILDEPTAALDPESEHKIQESLRKLVSGRTTFIIAHRLSTVRKADKIVVLHKKRIVEVGKHDELMAKKGIYYKFYTLQSGLA
ncbi:MAG: ABC transporter ATP-binding protein [Candidatus Nanoarchaeia archaeon]